MQSLLLMMLEFFKDANNKSKGFRALLTNMLKAFDCLFHDLLIAKLHAHDPDMPFLNLLYD